MRPTITSKLTETEYLAKPIFNTAGKILLKKGLKLSDKYIKRLKQLGIRTVYIEDKNTDDIIIKDVIREKDRINAITEMNKILTTCSVVKKTNKIKIGLDPLIKLTENLLTELLLKKGKLAVLLMDVKSFENYTAAHSVNVGVLSMITGLGLNYKKEKLFELGIGAILHDIGKSKTPIKILNKPGKLTTQEFEIIKNHTLLGYEIVTNFNELSDDAKQISLQHHEKYNSNGYPYCKSNEEISDFSKITAISDVYDALTSDRVYKNKIQPDMALKIIKGSSNSHFDKKYVDAFAKHVFLYPKGCIVKFLSGEIGIVVHSGPKEKGKFIVRLLYDHEMKKLSHPVDVDLNKEKDLRIVKIIENLPEE